MLARRVVPAFLALAASLLAPVAASAHGAGHGAVFTLTNATTGNAVAVFDRHDDGTLSPAGTVSTGGTGTGGGLGSQGAIALSRDGRHLLAVNAGSNTIAELVVRGHHVRLVATVPSGGTMPVSVTVRGRLVYVLNAGGAGNIAGFRIGRHHGLTPLAGSAQPLGAGSAGPAQVAFTPDGSALVVTEKVSSTIDTYPVDGSGVAGAPSVSSSAGTTPFGFDFDRRGHLLVSEAGGTASSYRVSAGGVSVITGALATRPGGPLLARPRRPLRLHRQRRLGDHLQLPDRARRLPHAARPERRHGRPRRRKPPAR